MNIALQLSCYNGGKYLPYLFESLKNQTEKNWKLFILDNASNEENKILIEQAAREAQINAKLFRLEKNIGFAGAHNFLFEKHKNESDYVFLLNDDAILEQNYIESLIQFLESNKNFASCSGVIYRWNFDERNSESKGKTEMIDTLGLEIKKTGAVIDIAAGEIIPKHSLLKFPNNQTTKQPNNQVFGVSGCLPCYRTSIVKLLSIVQTLFDPTFVIYKEDVELSYRFQSAGYKSATVFDAIAYHRRSLGKKSTNTPDPQAKYRSLQNHLWIHLMHTDLKTLFFTEPLILPYEIVKFGYSLLKRPKYVFDILKSTKKEWKNLMKKRMFIKIIKAGTKQAKTISHPSNLSSISSKIDIAILMVSHNDLSKDCLESIKIAQSKTTLKTKLIICDNHSKKYHANEFVKPIIDDAIVVLRNKDFGYGRSMNRASREINAKYYFILNPDTVLTDENIFQKMFEKMEQDQTIGILAPKIFYFDGKLQETCRTFPKWFMPFITRSSLQNTTFGKKYMREFCMRDYDHLNEKNVDWAQGSAMFISGDLWKLLDGFDDRYWLYFEDIDLCRRIHLLQKQVLYFPPVVMKHAHGKESATYSNILINLIKKKEARGHIASWMKYLLKWKFI